MPKQRNQILHDVREAVRHPYAWPGGYPIYVYMTDGEMLCRDCVRSNYREISHATRHKERSGWAAAGVDVYWEGPNMFCAQCNKELESAYGDPDAEEETDEVQS